MEEKKTTQWIITVVLLAIGIVSALHSMWTSAYDEYGYMNNNEILKYICLAAGYALLTAAVVKNQKTVCFYIGCALCALTFAANGFFLLPFAGWVITLVFAVLNNRKQFEENEALNNLKKLWFIPAICTVFTSLLMGVGVLLLMAWALDIDMEKWTKKYSEEMKKRREAQQAQAACSVEKNSQTAQTEEVTLVTGRSIFTGKAVLISFAVAIIVAYFTFESGEYDLEMAMYIVAGLAAAVGILIALSLKNEVIVTNKRIIGRGLGWEVTLPVKEVSAVSMRWGIIRVGTPSGRVVQSWITDMNLIYKTVNDLTID